MPNGDPWLRIRARELLGAERCFMQGAVVGVDNMDDKQQEVMVGESYMLMVALAVVLGILSVVPLPKQ